MNLDAKLIFEEFRNILKNDKDNIQKVKVITRPFRFGKTIVDRITTTEITKPDEPQITITNPLDEDVRITAITLIPDGTNFITKGLLKLSIDEVTVLEINNAADLTDLNNLPLSIPNEGWEIKRGRNVELYAWTSDGTSSSITLIVHFQR